LHFGRSPTAMVRSWISLGNRWANFIYHCKSMG
jgi:hypothetical protein